VISLVVFVDNQRSASKNWLSALATRLSLNFRNIGLRDCDAIDRESRPPTHHLETTREMGFCDSTLDFDRYENDEVGIIIRKR